MSNRYIESHEYTKMLHIDATNLHGWSMSQYLPYKDIRFKNDVNIVETLETDDCAETGYFVEVDLHYPNELKEKSKNFRLYPVNQKANINDFSEYMKSIKQEIYRPHAKIKCDWSDKLNYLFHYRHGKTFW